MGIANEFLKHVVTSGVFRLSSDGLESVENLTQALDGCTVFIMDMSQSFYRIQRLLLRTKTTECYQTVTDCFLNAPVLGDIRLQKNGTVENTVAHIQSESCVVNALLHDTIDLAVGLKHMQERSGAMSDGMISDVILSLDNSEPFAKKTTLKKRKMGNLAQRWLDTIEDERVKREFKDKLAVKEIEFPFTGSLFRLLKLEGFRMRMLRAMRDKLQNTGLFLPFRIYLLHRTSSSTKWWSKIYGSGAWTNLERTLDTHQVAPAEADIAISMVVDVKSSGKKMVVSSDTDCYLTLLSSGTNTVLMDKRPLITASGHLSRQARCLHFGNCKLANTPIRCLEFLLLISIAGSDYHQAIPEITRWAQLSLYREFHDTKRLFPFITLDEERGNVCINASIAEKHRLYGEIRDQRNVFCFRFQDTVYFFIFNSALIGEFLLHLADFKKGAKVGYRLKAGVANEALLGQLENNFRRHFYLIEYMTHCDTKIDLLVKRDADTACKYGFDKYGHYLTPFVSRQKLH